MGSFEVPFFQIVGKMRTIVYNLIALVVLGLLLVNAWFSLGHRHTFNLLVNDYFTSLKYSDMDMDERNVIKLGMGHVYLDYIRSHTPDSAVIYFPGQDAFVKDGSGDKFCFGYYGIDRWAERFLYPRKVVMESEYEMVKDHLVLTHVFVVNGKGAERLDYPVPENAHYQIFPINR